MRNKKLFFNNGFSSVSKMKRYISMVLLVCISMFLSACMSESQQVINENSGDIVAKSDDQIFESGKAEDNVLIETSICPILFPKGSYENLEYFESSQNGETAVFFYAVSEDKKQEAFRILFSSLEKEDSFGSVKSVDGELYVSVAVCDYDEKDFADEQLKENYYTVVSALNTVIESIKENEDYKENTEIKIAKSTAKLKYWNISLLDNMEMEETNESNYQVTCYGYVNGERIKLYSVAVGETPLASKLGFYKVGEEIMPVSVESYEFPATETWSERHITELYTMMSTINDVIQTIMSDANFSEQLPE